MSRIRTIFLGLLLAVSLGSAALAAEDQAGELVYRASLGRADDVRLLLKQKVSPDSKNDIGIPALALAATRTDLEGLNVVQALVDAGANIEAHDANGETPLFYAAKLGNVPIVHYLLEHHANAFAIDATGNQPRMVAYLAGQQEVVAMIDAFVRKQSETITEQNTKEVELQQLQDKQAHLSKENEQLKQQIEQAKNAQQTPSPLSPEERKAASDLAFNVCAFQYWSYCSDQKQSAELDAEALDAAIASYQEQGEAVKNQLAQDYKMDIPQINKVVASSQRRIFNQLNAMESNAGRREQGVGKRDDMKHRCEAIAREWEAPVPEIVVPKDDIPAATAKPATGSHPKIHPLPKPVPAPAAGDNSQQPQQLHKISDDFLMNLHPSQ